MTFDPDEFLAGEEEVKDDEFNPDEFLKKKTSPSEPAASSEQSESGGEPLPEPVEANELPAGTIQVGDRYLSGEATAMKKFAAPLYSRNPGEYSESSLNVFYSPEQETEIAQRRAEIADKRKVAGEALVKAEAFPEEEMKLNAQLAEADNDESQLDDYETEVRSAKTDAMYGDVFTYEANGIAVKRSEAMSASMDKKFYEEGGDLKVTQVKDLGAPIKDEEILSIYNSNKEKSEEWFTTEATRNVAATTLDVMAGVQGTIPYLLETALRTAGEESMADTLKDYQTKDKTTQIGGLATPEMFRQAAKKLRANNFQTQNTIVDLLSAGRIGDAAKMTFSEGMGSAPYTALAAVPVVGLTLMGTATAANKRAEFAEAGVDDIQALYGAGVVGTGEAVSEKITLDLMKGYFSGTSKSIARNITAAKAAGAPKDVLTAYTKAFVVGSAGFVKDMATKEMPSEFVASINESIVANAVGAEEIFYEEAIKRATNESLAAIGLLGAGAAISLVKKSANLTGDLKIANSDFKTRYLATHEAIKSTTGAAKKEFISDREEILDEYVEEVKGLSKSELKEVTELESSVAELQSQKVPEETQKVVDAKIKEKQDRIDEIFEESKKKVDEAKPEQPPVDGKESNPDSKDEPEAKEQKKEQVEIPTGKVTPKNKAGFKEVFKRMFGLKDKQAEAVTEVYDVVLGAAARRAGETKETFLKKIGFQKGDKKKTDELSDKGEALFQGDKGEENYKKWKGEKKEYSGADVQDVKTGEPVVVRAHHGTSNEFNEFDSSVKGNIEGHLGKVNYFTSDQGDAAQNYQSDGADLTSRIESREDQIDQDIENDFNGFETDKDIKAFIEEHNLTEEDVKEIFGKDTYSVHLAQDKAGEFSAFVARKELQGGEDIVKDVYVKLENPVVLGKKSSWTEVFPRELYEDSIEDAEKEIAEENDITVEEAREDYQWEIDQRAMELEGIEENPMVTAMNKALQDNGYQGVWSDVQAHEVLGDAGYEMEVDLSALEKSIRSSDKLYDNEDGEIASSQVIADFFKNLGYDGIILTDVADRFKGMNLGSETSHIHVFDENANQIKLSDGSNVTFDENTKDIRFQNEKGAMLAKDGNKIVFALTDPDVSTPLHELAHIWEHYLTEAEKSQILEWAGQETWNTEVSEKFARGFENYLATGKAPTTQLQELFESFKAWLTEIYNGITGSEIDIKLNDSMTKIYDAMFDEQANVETSQSETQTRKEARASEVSYKTEVLENDIQEFEEEIARLEEDALDKEDEEHFIMIENMGPFKSSAELKDETGYDVGIGKDININYVDEKRGGTLEDNVLYIYSTFFDHRSIDFQQDIKNFIIENIGFSKSDLKEPYTHEKELIGLRKNLKDTKRELRNIKLEDGKNQRDAKKRKDADERIKKGKKPRVSDKASPEEAARNKEIEEAAKALAAKVRSGKFLQTISDLENLQSSPGALFQVAWDGALEITASTIEAGGTITQAIVDAVNHIKASDWYKGLSTEGKVQAEEIVTERLTDELLLANEKPKKKSTERTIVKHRAYDGDVRAGVKKALVKVGLNREVENQQTAKAKAKEFIEIVGEADALEAVLNNDIPGAAGAYVFSELIESVEKQLATEKDPAKIIELEQAEARLLDEFDKKATSQGRFISALHDIYQNSDFGYNAEVQIKNWKELHNGEISPAVEAKFRELDEQLREVKKKLIEAEAKAVRAQEELAIENILEDIQRKNKPKAKQDFVKRTIKAIGKVRANIRANSYSDATGMVAIVDSGLLIIEKSLKAGLEIADAIDAGVRFIKKKLKEQGIDKWEKESQFRKDVQEGLADEGITVGKKPKVKNGKLLIPHSIIRELVERGYDNIEDLTAAVKEMVIGAIPDITDREVRDAITGYGKVVNPNKDEVSAEIRKLKRAGRIMSGLEDIRNKKRPLKSGVQRDKLDAKERAEARKLREALKELPLDEEAAASELKTATDALKQRLRNEIEDLQLEIDKREKVERSAKSVKDDAELIALREMKAEKKKEHDSIFKNEEFLQKKRLDLTKRATERRISELQRRLRESDFTKKKVKPLLADKELTELRGEKIRLQDEFAKEVHKEKLRNRSVKEKIGDFLWDAWGLTRALRATGEFSFVLIQGLIQTIAHPIHAVKAFKNAIKFMGSEKRTENWLADVKAQKWYPEMNQSKLSLTEPHAELTAREELFYSDWINFAWDIAMAPTKLISPKVYEKAKELSPFKMIERAAIGYLDTMRVMRWLDGKQMLDEKGLTFENNPEAYKEMADVINTFTGRASLGKVEQQAEVLTKIFFSPRNWASVFKTATPYAFYHFGRMRAGAVGFKPSVAQKMALMDFSKYVGLTASIVALAALHYNNDDDDETGVEMDPTSSDFLKIKLGNTRIDPWGGRIQQVVLTARFMYQSIKKSDGQEYPLGTPNKTPTMEELLLEQAFNKLAPSASVVHRYLSSREKTDASGTYRIDKYGNEFTFEDQITENLYPIYWETIKEVNKEHGVSAFSGLLHFYAFMGGGVNVYKTNIERKKERIDAAKKRVEEAKANK